MKITEWSCCVLVAVTASSLFAQPQFRYPTTGRCDSQGRRCTEAYYNDVAPYLYDVEIYVFRTDDAFVHIYPGTVDDRIRDVTVNYLGVDGGTPNVRLFINGAIGGGAGSELQATNFPGNIRRIRRGTTNAGDAGPRILLRNVRVAGSLGTSEADGISVDVNDIINLDIGGDLIGNVYARAAGGTSTQPGPLAGAITSLTVRGSVLGNIESTGVIELLDVKGNLGSTGNNYVRAYGNITTIQVGSVPALPNTGLLRSNVATKAGLGYLSAASTLGDIYCRDLGVGTPGQKGIRVAGELGGRVLVAADYIASSSSLVSAGAIRSQLTFGAFNYIDTNGVLQPQPQPFQWLGAVSTSFGGGTRVLPTVPNPTTPAQEYNSGLIGGGAAGVFPFTVWRRDCSPPMIEGRAGMVTVANFMSGAANVVVSHNGPVARKNTAVGSASPVQVQYQNFATFPATWDNVPMNQTVSSRSVTLSKVDGVVYQPGRYRVMSQNLKSVVAGTQHPAASFPNVADVTYRESLAYEFILGGCVIGGNVNPADVAGAGYNGLYPDGIIDGNDFVAFINAFSAGELLADIAGGTDPSSPCGGADGTVDGSDFICFINNFALGC